MPLNEVIRACTETPARHIKLEGRVGTLKPGSDADIAILKIRDKPMTFHDAWGNSAEGSQLLIPQLTVKSGRIVYKRIEFDL
jgi:dihydroorotase